MRSAGRREPGFSSRSRRVLVSGLLLAFAAVNISLGALTFDVVRDAVVSWTLFPDLPLGPEDGYIVYPPGELLPIWSGTNRVTVLLLGIDRRPGDSSPARTDSMLLLTIDPVVKTAAVLSIPRDLWVSIPMGENRVHGRINSAHYLGELYDWPGGGPALAADTVEYNLGVSIDYYARVDFLAFEHLIDLIGGVDVHVEEDIWDPEYPDDNYGFDPVYIPAGQHHFSGEMALKYARVRHGGSDYDRTRRQRCVLEAAFDKVTRLDMIPSLLPVASELWKTLQASVVVSPDLSLNKIIALARLASQVDAAKLGFYAIDQSYAESLTTPDGQMVEMPDWDRIRELRDSIFMAGLAPDSDGGQEELEAEAGRVQVLNGTLVAGLASQAADTLRQAGVNVVDVGNAERSDCAETQIIVHTSKMLTAERIRQALGLELSAVVSAESAASEYDIVVILGSDYSAGGG